MPRHGGAGRLRPRAAENNSFVADHTLRWIGSRLQGGHCEKGEAVGYLRTSSTATVGDGKDSEARQRKAIEGYAKAGGLVIVDWFYDAAVSGADPIEARPGFAARLARIAGNGVLTIVVETANRFARDLMVQEVGFAMLRDLGVTLIAADSHRHWTALVARQLRTKPGTFPGLLGDADFSS
jgi:hypothetical protein